MAELIKTLRASGGDYTSIQTWWDTEAKFLDCVATTTSPVLECYNDWPGGLDAASIDFSPGIELEAQVYAANMDHHPIIRAATGHGHGGVSKAGFWASYGGNYDYTLGLGSQYVHMQDIEIWNTGSSYGRAIRDNSGYQFLDNVLAGSNSINSTAYAHVFKWFRNGSVLRNCVALKGSVGFSANDGNAPTFINCVTANQRKGVDTGKYGGNPTLKNTVAYNCVESYAINTSGSYNADSTNNAASDAETVTPPGSNPLLTNVTSADFVDAANDDYHLSPTSILRGAGANLYDGTGQTDIDGDVWPNAAWDIGFDYYVAAGGTTAVTTDLTLRWDLLQQLTTDNDTRWHILNAVDTDLQTAWQLLNQVTRDEFTSWDILQQLTRDVNISWDVLAALYHVTTDVTLLFNIVNAVQRDRQLAWDILNRVTRDQATAWNLLNGLTRDVQADWHILEAVERNVDFKWNVDSTLTPITTDLNIQWNTLQAITRSFDTQWDLLEAITNDQDIRWGVANAVVAELNTHWDIANRVVTDYALRWNTLEARQSSLTLQWSVDGRAITPIVFIRVAPENRQLAVLPEIREIPVPAENRIIPVRRV